MQNSRLSRMGKQSLKNRSNFTLLQQINPQQFWNDQPIKNSNTLYLDENGRQTQFAQLMKSNLYRKPTRKQLRLDDTEVNTQDMYALPVVNNANASNSSFLIRSNQKNNPNGKLIKSQYLTDRRMLDSVREVDQSGISRNPDAGRNLLSIKRPKAFQKRNKFQEIDFIGDNLYQVEDIIKDIGKIMDKTKTSNIIAPSKQPKTTLKSNKWLNNNFGNMSKLDEMLLSYKTSGEKQTNFPIIQDYYRESEKEEKQKPELKVEDKNKSKINSVNFGNRGKNNQYKLSLVIVRWSQLPMIASKWQPELYLKLQSYPQQEQYRKIVLKAYTLKIKTYSIFSYTDAGVFKPKSSNDKNTSANKLMSQQQYAKTWQQKYPSNDSLTEEQKQLLMQFDIEWYRTIIQLCYHSGLEDLLQKQYDISTYQTMMKSIQREQDSSAELIIRNQLIYLKEYFGQVYAYSSNETTIGMIRINNDEKMGIQDVQHNFQAMLNGSEGGEVEFSMWSMSEDNSDLVVMMQLCGDTSSSHINFNKDKQNIEIKMNNPNYTIQIMPYNNTLSQSQQCNSVLIKNSDQNDWEIYPKVKKDVHNNLKYGIKMTEELLFGLLYVVSVNKV